MQVLISVGQLESVYARETAGTALRNSGVNTVRETVRAVLSASGACSVFVSCCGFSSWFLLQSSHLPKLMLSERKIH